MLYVVKGLLCCDSGLGFGRIAGIDCVLSRVGEVKETRVERKMREKVWRSWSGGERRGIKRNSRKRIIRNGGEEERNGDSGGEKKQKGV